MSRSNPTVNTPNPSTRWFEWSGGKGGIKYYDKEAKVSVDVPLPFKFILLDKLATITGYSKQMGVGIFSNEVRDITREPFIVKAHKGGVIESGFYKDIKEKITSKAIGGAFTVNLYLAYKDGGDLKIGSLKLRGASLGAWMEFEKKNRRDLLTKAIVISGSATGKTGTVIYHTPTFELADVAEEANRLATALDIELQQYLNGYFASRTVEQVTTHEEVGERVYVMEEIPTPTEAPVTDDLPF